MKQNKVETIQDFGFPSCMLVVCLTGVWGSECDPQRVLRTAPGQMQGWTKTLIGNRLYCIFLLRALQDTGRILWQLAVMPRKHDYTEQLAESGILLQWPAASTLFGKRPPERMGWVAAIRRQLHTWQGTAGEEIGSERTPHRSVREDEMVTQTMGSTQACVRLASVWECLGKHAFSSPPTPAHAQNTLLPCLEHMVHQQRHLAALTPGSCASSLPVGSLGTATSSTTCGSSRVRRRAMNYFEAAAANLTSIQGIHCKHMMAAEWKPEQGWQALWVCFFLERVI